MRPPTDRARSMVSTLSQKMVCLRDEAVEKYHAIEGGQQTLNNLAAYVAESLRKEVEG